MSFQAFGDRAGGSTAHHNLPKRPTSPINSGHRPRTTNPPPRGNLSAESRVGGQAVPSVQGESGPTSPGKTLPQLDIVANPGRGQLNRGSVSPPVSVRSWEFGFAGQIRLVTSCVSPVILHTRVESDWLMLMVLTYRGLLSFLSLSAIDSGVHLHLPTAHLVSPVRLRYSLPASPMPHCTYTNSGCEERGARKKWPRRFSEQAAPVTRAALWTTGLVSADTRSWYTPSVRDCVTRSTRDWPDGG